MAGGSSPQTTSCSPGWVGLSEAVLQVWGWIGEVGQDQGLLSLLASLGEISHSICRRVVREKLGVPRHAVGHQSIMLWGLGFSDWTIRMPFQRQSHKNALTRTHFDPCWWITWEFLVFSSCPSSLPSILPWMGAGYVWWILISKAPGLFMSHSQVAVSLFRILSGTPFGYLFLYIL